MNPEKLSILFKSQIPDKSDSIETLSQASTFIGADEKVITLKEMIKVNARKKRKNHLVIKFILLEMIRYKQTLKEKQNQNHDLELSFLSLIHI